MIVHQPIQNKMGAGSAIIDVAHHMKVIDGQTLDGFGNHDDKGLGIAGPDNRIDQAFS